MAKQRKPKAGRYNPNSEYNLSTRNDAVNYNLSTKNIHRLWKDEQKDEFLEGFLTWEAPMVKATLVNARGDKAPRACLRDRCGRTPKSIETILWKIARDYRGMASKYLPMKRTQMTGKTWGDRELGLLQCELEPPNQGAPDPRNLINMAKVHQRSTEEIVNKIIELAEKWLVDRPLAPLPPLNWGTDPIVTYYKFAYAYLESRDYVVKMKRDLRK